MSSQASGVPVSVSGQDWVTKEDNWVKPKWYIFSCVLLSIAGFHLCWCTFHSQHHNKRAGRNEIKNLFSWPFDWPLSVLLGRGQDCVEVSHALPHQSCLYGPWGPGTEKDHPQIVYTTLKVWNCPNCFWTGDETEPFTTRQCAAAAVRLGYSCLAMEAQSISSPRTALELIWCLKVWFYGLNPVTWLLSFTTASVFQHWSQHWAIAQMDSERRLEFSELLPRCLTL